jgi:hypothetical protein
MRLIDADGKVIDGHREMGDIGVICDKETPNQI